MKVNLNLNFPNDFFLETRWKILFVETNKTQWKTFFFVSLAVLRTSKSSWKPFSKASAFNSLENLAHNVSFCFCRNTLCIENHSNILKYYNLASETFKLFSNFKLMFIFVCAELKTMGLQRTNWNGDDLRDQQKNKKKSIFVCTQTADKLLLQNHETTSRIVFWPKNFHSQFRTTYFNEEIIHSKRIIFIESWTNGWNMEATMQKKVKNPTLQHTCTHRCRLNGPHRSSSVLEQSSFLRWNESTQECLDLWRNLARLARKMRNFWKLASKASSSMRNILSGIAALLCDVKKLDSE